MPTFLPQRPPWRRCLYCHHFGFWEGPLGRCGLHGVVLSLEITLGRRCTDWRAGPTARQRWSSCAPIDND
jgi:hypothetical protein